MEQIDCVIAGAGVIGLACARTLAQRGLKVLIVEREAQFGTQTSARNSEVIHAGLYYPAGSLKARLCAEGRDRLYAYLSARGLPFRQCGKLIVATDPAQEAALEIIRTSAAANVVSLDQLTARQAQAMEPQLSCTAALHSPLTGIFDSHAYMSALLAEAEAAGAMLATRTELDRGEVTGHGFRLRLVDVQSREAVTIDCRHFVNAAGHGAARIAARLDGLPESSVPRLFIAKGSYFACPGRPAFDRLIYPVPVAGGLGVHLTLDLQGQMRFGPDVEWLDLPDLTVDPAKTAAFAEEIARYWPRLPREALVPAFAGLRPKLNGPGEAAADFRIDTEADHGIPHLVQLFGIESPGLTASLALAETVGDVVLGRAGLAA